MNAEQAWQSVLDQLQREMPRAWFETWVRDTRLLSYNNGTVMIAARNQYARDWLENRLTSTVSPLLAGMLDCKVDVQFTVFADATDEDSPEEAHDDSLVSIEVIDQTPYETIVRPEKIIAFPAYALRLLWEDVDHPVFWLWVGLRQSVWSLRRNSKQWHVNASRIYSNAGFSRASFWRLIAKESTWQQLHGMAAQLPVEKRYYHGRDGQPHAVANRYQVSFSPRLTTKDAYRLYTLLQESTKGIEPGEKTLHLTARLKELSAARVQDYLPNAHEKVEDGARGLTCEVCTVTDVVRLVTGIEETLPSELESAADELQRRIISAFGTAIFPQYFIQVVVPQLGLTPAQASLRILMMDRCYANRESGEVRDSTSVPGGYETLAAWLNISRPKTIREWLSGSPMKNFIQEIVPSDGQYSDKRCFKVRLDELVIPDSFVGANETHRAGAVETHRAGANETHSEAQLRLIAGANETHRVGAIETHLKSSFKSLSNTEKTNSLNTTSTGLSSSSKPGAVAAAWDLNQILAFNNVHPRLRRQIQDTDPKVLVSFVLWAVSPQGAGLERPLNYALSQLKADPESAGPGGAFDFFAHLPRSELLDLIEATPKTFLDQFREKSPGCHSKHLDQWLKTMCNDAGRCPNLSELRAILFGRQIE